MGLVRKIFPVNNGVDFDCWIFKTPDSKFWFKGYDVANFLGYCRPGNAVNNVLAECKSSWENLTAMNTLIDCRSNRHPNTVFISEPSLYALTTRSRLPEAVRFTNWVYEDVLPSLRENPLPGYLTNYRNNTEMELCSIEAKCGLVYLSTTDVYEQNSYDRLAGLNVVRLDNDSFFYVMRGAFPIVDSP